MKDNTDIRRAAAALRRSTAADPDDFEHPGYDQLEAFVDGRLNDVDREIVESHVELCASCAQDVSDLRGVRDDLRAPVFQPAALPKPSSMPFWKIAAVAVAAIGIGALARMMFVDRGNAPNSVPLQTATAKIPAAQTPTTSTPGALGVQAGGNALTSDERAVVARALSSNRLEVPQSIRELATPAGTLLGGAKAGVSLTPLGPLGTAVTSTMPELSWTTVPGATYSVAIFDESFNEITRADGLNTATWTPTRALPRATALAWQVTAHIDGRDIVAPAPPQPEARFVVLDAAAAANVAAQRARLKQQPLELAVLLASAGLIDEAKSELVRAATQPVLSDSAKALLASLKK